MAKKRKKVTKKEIKSEIKNCSSFRLANAIFDLELVSLRSKTITPQETKNLWKADPRYPSDCYSRFLRYNHRSLRFLGIAYQESIVLKTLTLTPSLQVGCAPLFSPKTGKPCGNIVVKSRFQEDIAGISSIINSELVINYEPELLLNNSPLANPPLYLECIKFIDMFSKSKRAKWQKFANYSKVEKLPSSSTDWSKYALNSFDPQKVFNYPNKVNRLILNHPEWEMLKYVLLLSINEIESTRTPQKVKQELFHAISQFKVELQGTRFKVIHEIPIHASDPLVIKETKDIANRILKNQTTQSCAWTLDISNFFERFVQYIFEQATKRLGGRVISNQKYSISGQRPEWALKYIEPDIIVKLTNKTIIADAKYKRHMTSLYDKKNKNLKEEFRSDLHQVLAYSSMAPDKNKEIMLCYPSFSDNISKIMYVHNPVNGLSTKIILIGLPIQKETIETSIRFVCGLLK